MKPTKEKTKPGVATEGIYYLVPFPQEWRILPVRYDVSPDVGHPHFWEDSVALILAKAWQPTLSKAFPTLERLRGELLVCVYAFPRGRVTLMEGKFIVYHGMNVEKFMQTTRSAIEKCFDIQGRAVWQFDDHEQCQLPDKEHARELLHLREDWKAV